MSLRIKPFYVFDAIVAALIDSGYSLETSEEIAFHMLDWYDDLNRFVSICNDPQSHNPKEISKILSDFLVHVPNHVAAAKKHMTGHGVSDTFGVGAVEQSPCED